METTIRSHSVSVAAEAELTKTTSDLGAYLDQLEAYRFGFAPMILIVMVCLGGIAAGFAVHVSELQLMAVAVSTVFIEVLIIALAPMRMIFWASVAAFLIDFFIFLF